ncbi:A/G-specific adenine glycosylase [Sulfurimonas sp. MAG313]|nr:A/G-specific adenine glycosylase [Sulfurimonas sp. MAG313]MDF1879853.1 A/G-specific adenine glycosylase [Sulfurimonas sp. MAG313]
MFKKVHNNLALWYKENGRHDLPWRNIDDAYKIWVSEVMLQQTQVKTVLERFYFPFLETFPTLQDLALASEDEVLKKWEGLGYYTRARNLHKTAKLSKESLPLTVTELISMPGIGQSTAHAIAAFAYKTPVPILDANVKRILYRIFAVTKASDKELWKMAYAFFDEKRPYDFNQAMMDIGSIICISKIPKCQECPFEDTCKGKYDPLLYPQKKIKKARPLRKKNIIIHFYKNKLALQQRQSRFLNGLWGFSEYNQHEDINFTELLGEITHIYSHFKLHARVHLYHSYIDEHQWYSLEEIKELALSTADHKVLQLYLQKISFKV